MLDVGEAKIVNVTVANSTNQSFENAVISIYDLQGSLRYSGVGSLRAGLEPGHEYDFQLTMPINSTDSMRAVIRRLNVSSDLNLRPQTVVDYGGDLPASPGGETLVAEVTPLFALNDSDLIYNRTELYIPEREIEILYVVHCKDWNFSTGSCSDWDINATSDYNMQDNGTYIWFNVTRFHSFGGGSGNPVPNVTQIRVYDVTGQSDTHTGGNLTGSGLDKTFYFFQRTPKLYRVEMTIRNDGNARWNLAANDDVHHEGLNSAWDINNVNDIWYNIGGTNHTAGNWSNGKVVWNTSLGGGLNAGATMTFNYMFNMTTSNNEEYPVYFLCNDTSARSGSYDNSTYNITRLGYLDLVLALPPQIPGLGNASNNTGLTAYMIGFNRTFFVNATLYCRDGYCGIVNGTLRYNKSSADPDTPVNTTLKDQPFYVMDGINPKYCGNNPMKEDDYCNVTWYVNATGSMHSIWKMDVQFRSNYSLTNDTGDVSIEVTKVLIIALSWDVANFGVCNPMSYGNPALLNQQGYNITIDNNSNDVDGLYIKGTNLDPVNVSALNGISYGIGVGNFSWYYLDDYSKASRLTNQYYLMNQSLATSTVIRNYYWIDVPSGQYTQDYAGKLYIMANASV